MVAGARELMIDCEHFPALAAKDKHGDAKPTLGKVRHSPSHPPPKRKEVGFD
jgi:hypothetical protein